MMDDADDELLHLTGLSATLRRRLHILEMQWAAYGNLAVPAHLLLEKEDTERQLRQTLDALRALGSHGGTDGPPTTPTPSQPVPRSPVEEDTTLAPFIFGPPITHPRAFFGRDQIVQRIFDLLKRLPLHNAVIIGPRRSGKTSLLHYLQSITRTPVEQLRPEQRTDWLPDSSRYRWLRVDFQDARLGKRQGLLRYLLTGLGLEVPRPCTLDRFLDVMSEVRSPTIILLDEIGTALHRYSELDDDVWESLRALGPQVGGNLGFVLASHVSPIRIAHDSGHSSPFFNIFGYRATIGPLTGQESRALIASSPIPFPEADVEWILAQSRGWPILLQILCHERLVTLEAGESGQQWRDEGLLQMKPFQHLLAIQS